jgi:hypothetical protein
LFLLGIHVRRGFGGEILVLQHLDLRPRPPASIFGIVGLNPQNGLLLRQAMIGVLIDDIPTMTVNDIFLHDDLSQGY